jgi:hypothetical protein
MNKAFLSTLEYLFTKVIEGRGHRHVSKGHWDLTGETVYSARRVYEGITITLTFIYKSDVVLLNYEIKNNNNGQKPSELIQY